ncbi:hypothetical protein [Nonomuraea sp. NPDC049695]|uniref:hypothetical protein n=1 Tax=Nonomuraea sp. NPDC049695 TaxID=3154734 RepID=UPI0034222060
MNTFDTPQRTARNTWSSMPRPRSTVSECLAISSDGASATACSRAGVSCSMATTFRTSRACVVELTV